MGAVWCVGKPPKNAASRPDLIFREYPSLKGSMPRTSRLSLQAVRENSNRHLVPQIARFAVVGVINTPVDLAVLNTATRNEIALKRLIQKSRPPAVADGDQSARRCCMRTRVQFCGI